jgi:hypothetical protein
MCVSEASVMGDRTAPGAGWARGTAAMKAAFTGKKAVSISALHGNSLGGFPERAAVSGRSIRAACGRNLL